MTTYIITRHAGSLDWLKQRGVEGEWIYHMEITDIARLQPGDTVIGTLPIPVVAAVCAAGARYLHLTVDVDAENRGKELSTTTLDRFGARLEAFHVTPVDDGKKISTIKDRNNGGEIS
ncbi:CRISPR-associated protein [Azospirillaceae bacterium]